MDLKSEVNHWDVPVWIEIILYKSCAYDIKFVNDLKKGIMIRRIKKNQKEDTKDIIPLPASLVKFIKNRKIKGELFPDTTVVQIDQLLNKTYDGKKATPHYWRSYYTVNVLSKMTNKDDIEEALRIMDHSLQVNASYYNKQASSAYNSLLAGK